MRIYSRDGLVAAFLVIQFADHANAQLNPKINTALANSEESVFATGLIEIGWRQNIVVDTAYNFFEATFRDQVSISHSRFDKKFQLKNSISDTDFMISGSVFKDTLYLELNEFNGNVSFSRDTFNKHFHFSGNCRKTLHLSDTEFRAVSGIWGSINELFGPSARFLDTILIGPGVNYMNFYSAKFEAHAAFQAGEFSTGIFSSCTFRSVDFSGCLINKKLDLSGAKIGDYILLNSVRTTDSTTIELINTVLPRKLDLGKITNLKSEIDLTLCDFTSRQYIDPKTGNYKRHEINIYGSDITKIHMDYIHFKLIFPIDANNGESIPEDEIKSVYESLLKNFRDRGQTLSAELLDIEYQQYRWKKSAWYIRWFGSLSDLWWKFGYAKHRVFAWSFLFIVLFTLTTAPILKFLQEKVYPSQAMERRAKATFSNLYTPLKKRLWYSFMYTSGLFFGLTLKPENFLLHSNTKSVLGTLYVIVIFMIGIICLAYMANFVLHK